jgi:hypothetical protein
MDWQHGTGSQKFSIYHDDQAKAKRQEEWKERKEAWEKRVREDLARNIERLEKAESALVKSQAHANELRERIRCAGNESFKERAGTWLKEEEERSKSIEQWVGRVKEWIAEDERKLRG